MLFSPNIGPERNVYLIQLLLCLGGLNHVTAYVHYRDYVIHHQARECMLEVYYEEMDSEMDGVPKKLLKGYRPVASLRPLNPFNK